jgi:hypothetical protein
MPQKEGQSSCCACFITTKDPGVEFIHAKTVRDFHYRLNVHGIFWPAVSVATLQPRCSVEWPPYSVLHLAWSHNTSVTSFTREKSPSDTELESDGIGFPVPEHNESPPIKLIPPPNPNGVSMAPCAPVGIYVEPHYAQRPVWWTDEWDIVGTLWKPLEP